MKVYRYMSMTEFTKMSAGCDITGRRYHKARTESEGVCFLSEKTHADGITYTPEQCLSFLAGIVTNDILVEFETEEVLQECHAIYADPQGDYYDIIVITEYCVPSYNRETFRPVRYAMVDYSNNADWYDFN